MSSPSASSDVCVRCASEAERLRAPSAAYCGARSASPRPGVGRFSSRAGAYTEERCARSCDFHSIASCASFDHRAASACVIAVLRLCRTSSIDRSLPDNRETRTSGRGRRRRSVDRAPSQAGRSGWTSLPRRWRRRTPRAAPRRRRYPAVSCPNRFSSSGRNRQRHLSRLDSGGAAFGGVA